MPLTISHSFPHYKEGHELLALTMMVLLDHDAVSLNIRAYLLNTRWEGLVILKILELDYIELPNHD